MIEAETAHAVTPPGTHVERRRAHRHRVDGEAEVLLADGMMLFCGRILDLTEHGCYIATRALLRMHSGTRVSMIFRIGDQTFRALATCRTARPQQGAGFCFETMSARHQTQLRIFIARLNAHRSEP